MISSGVSDQALHNLDHTNKGVDTLMENFDSNRFNNIDAIAKNIDELAKGIVDPTHFDIDSLVTETPLAGSKCPAY